PACELDLEVVEVVRKAGYERRLIRFSSTKYSRIPAYLLVPEGSGPFPAVLALHDHGGFFCYGKEKLVSVENEHPALTEFKERYYDGLSYADILAQKGYVVLVIDAFYWGERRMQFDPLPPELARRLEGLRLSDAEYVARVNGFLRERVYSLNTMLSFCGTNWLGILVHDDRRSLDLLSGLPEVDPQRIGVLGLSVGGYRTTYLAGLDDRVRAACIIGWMTKLRSCVSIGHPVHAGLPVADGLHAHLDHPDIATLAAPACALFVLNCARDALFTHEGMLGAVDAIRSVYDDMGARERFQAKMYDAPHEFNRQMQKDAFAWLDRWLQ
ncbi:MAG: dienelactone hydrolase family protein, partial [Limnochordia bacterium]